jgi:hypothetical protein
MKKDVNGSSGQLSDGGAIEIQAIRAARSPDQGIDHIKKGYLFCLLMTISIGTIQFGYSIGSWNTAFKAYAHKSNWD